MVKTVARVVPPLGVLAGLLLLVGTLVGTAQADVIRLKHAGQVRGELLPPNAEGILSIRTLSGTTISVGKDDVDFVQQRSLRLEEYFTRSQSIPHTVEAHWGLAEWSRQHQLMDQRREQLEQLLDLDPDHEQTRKILGYTRHNGRWMTRDDMMTERGYVKHKGRWVTSQELELIEQNTAKKEAEQAWAPKVRLWLGWLVGDQPQRRTDGLRELQSIREPDAVAALRLFLSNHEDGNIRVILVRTLGHIDGVKSINLLVDHMLLDADENVRQEAVNALNPARNSQAIPLLIKGLDNESNTVVCRSAEILGQLGDQSAVPALINALVTTHSYKVEVPANDGIGFVNVNAAKPFSGQFPPNIEIMSRTGQLPYGVDMVGDPITPRVTKTVSVTSEFKNEQVLKALEKLTGRNLGYNEQDWHLWWAIQKG